MTLYCAVCLERAHHQRIRRSEINEAITIAYGGDALCGSCMDEMRELMEDRNTDNARFLGRTVPVVFDIVDQGQAP